MQTLIFHKSSTDGVEPVLWSWNEQSVDQLNADFNQPGRVILAPNSSFPLFVFYFDAIEHVNCNIKKDKVELYRSLRLHLKKEQTLLRRIIANYPDIHAFRRSFFQFLNRYYHCAPPCIIFILDDFFDVHIETYREEPVKDFQGDPIQSLINQVSHEQTVKDLEKVFIGVSQQAKYIRMMIYKASLSTSPVLILGESGTGKDIIAKQIIKYSKGSRRKFTIVNCSTITETIAESELFGHTKGSFTHATENRKGLFNAENGGTLFLDEIGDLSLQNQAKILRAIENMEIRAIGSNKDEVIDVRIIAATNKNLHAMIEEGRFREDLYYRLNTFTIFTSSLREQLDDIPIIAEQIWSDLTSKEPSIKLRKYLLEYHWPGNVRELKTTLKHVFEMFGDIPLQPDHIESIKKYKMERVAQSTTRGKDDFQNGLNVESKTHLIEVQNIMRGIKIEVRPILHHGTIKKDDKKSLENFRKCVSQGIKKLDDLCREPIYFKDKELFDKITRFRYLLEKKINDMPDSVDELNEFWRTRIEEKYNNIDEEIYKLVWGNIKR